MIGHKSELDDFCVLFKPDRHFLRERDFSMLFKMPEIWWGPEMLFDFERAELRFWVYFDLELLLEMETGLKGCAMGVMFGIGSYLTELWSDKVGLLLFLTLVFSAWLSLFTESSRFWWLFVIASRMIESDRKGRLWMVEPKLLNLFGVILFTEELFSRLFSVALETALFLTASVGRGAETYFFF